MRQHFPARNWFNRALRPAIAAAALSIAAMPAAYAGITLNGLGLNGLGLNGLGLNGIILNGPQSHNGRFESTTGSGLKAVRLAFPDGTELKFG